MGDIKSGLKFNRKGFIELLNMIEDNKVNNIYITYTYSLNQYMLFNIFVWVIGSAGAITWYILGKETGKDSLNY